MKYNPPPQLDIKLKLTQMNASTWQNCDDNLSTCVLAMKRKQEFTF